jgi:SAM-dependent methyltransferase
MAGAALLRLQRGLTSERLLAGAGYMEDPDLLGAYLLYYWPVSYLEAALSLAMIGRSPRRVLDLGSGPGPLAAALIDAGAAEIKLVDGSPAALALAHGLLGKPGLKLSTTSLDLQGGEGAGEGPYDAIVSGHLLNELWKEAPDRVERRRVFIETQAAALAPGGFVLVIEPALLSTSRETLALRDALAARGWKILAPCPSSLPCPALAAGPSRTCHGEAAWMPAEPMASLALRAGLDRSSVKWIWFCASPPDTRADASLPPPEAATLPSGSLGPARVVSEGLLNKAGRLRYLLCCEGRLTTLSAPRAMKKAAESGFLGLGRYDLVAVEAAEIREGGLGLSDASTFTLVARAPGIESR